MGCAAETASQNMASERDALSQTALKRKPYPALERGLRKNWPVIWFGLEYARIVDVGRCGHGDR